MKSSSVQMTPLFSMDFQPPMLFKINPFANDKFSPESAPRLFVGYSVFVKRCICQNTKSGHMYRMYIFHPLLCRVHNNSPYFPNYYISLHCYAQLSASISDTQALPLSPPHSDMPWQLTTKMVSESTVTNPFLHNIIHYYKLSPQCQILSILLCPSLMLMLLEILK